MRYLDGNLIDEKLLVGRWLFKEGRRISDDVSKRIIALTQCYLVKLDHDTSGWLTLYRNPADGVFWELDYPESELQGGGPPRLRAISPTEARQRYNYLD